MTSKRVVLVTQRTQTAMGRLLTVVNSTRSVLSTLATDAPSNVNVAAGSHEAAAFKHAGEQTANTGPMHLCT